MHTTLLFAKCRFFYPFLIALIITSRNANHVSCFVFPVQSFCRNSFLESSSLRIRNLNGSCSGQQFPNSRGSAKVNIRYGTRLCSRDTKNLTPETTPALEFNGRYTFEVLSLQSLIVVVSVAAAIALSIPNYGLGANILLDAASVKLGIVATIPLFLLAFGLDLIEKYVPALQDVTIATQQSILSLLGTQWKPFTALLVALAAGTIAGIGEEMLFRGIMQTWLSDHFGVLTSLALSSLIFGALHAVTPLYAALTFVGSLYFGVLYIASQGNLVVPIVCHAVYDVVVLMWAHYVVTSMTRDEQNKVLQNNTSSRELE